ncbi:MAG: phosphatase PAP2 family protein [Candidatus Magnetoovum sp. WYHC-5]|nr:phosphatase PAP2 family protein [Candidatus Magnetoovum sp. WYHC-5]
MRATIISQARIYPLLYAGILVLPVCFIYIDRVFMQFMESKVKTIPVISVFLSKTEPIVDFLGYGANQMLVALFIVLIGMRFNKDMYLLGRDVCISLLSCGVIVQTIKHTIGRARPRITDSFELSGPGFKAGHDSFPSGHTAGAFCIAYILAQRYPKYSVVFYVVAIFVGFERISDGAHFPSDTIAGAFIGIYIAKYILSRFKLKENKENSSN